MEQTGDRQDAPQGTNENAGGMDAADRAGDASGGATRSGDARTSASTGGHRGILLLISGPAGSGKTTLCDRLLTHDKQVQRVVTSTSRAPRDGEKHGVDYYFFAPEEFQRRIAAGEFYEWAQVHGRYYGTLRSEIDDKLAAGVDLLINVDVQGASTFRKVAADTQCALHGRLITVFVGVSDLDELRRRLRGRGTDDEAEIEHRMQTAIKELEQAPYYDFVIDSRDREQDFTALLSCYEQARTR